MWSARAERKAFKPAAETIEVESMSAGFLVVAAMAALGGLGARWLARRALSAGESLIEDRLAQTRGLTVALGIALALATPLVVLLLGGVQSMLADPLFFFSPWTAIAALAIGPAMLAGYHPLRAHALGDRWSCFAYVSWTLRFALVLGGPWILLFLGPSMTHVAADGAFVTASGLLVGLGLWARFFVVSTEWLLDGRPLAEDDAARAQIIRRAGIPDLRVVGTAPDDATWTTVLSLPIGPSPSLFVSRSFLEKLGRRGLQGVLAREAARIRHVRRTSWLGPVVPALIVGASVVEPLIARLDPGLAEAYRWIWVGGFIAVPLLVGARQLRIERDLDRRAVELLGGDEHAVGIVEEALRTTAEAARWPHSSMSGPIPGTLASRIAALRSGDEGGWAVSPPLTPATFQSKLDPQTWLAIDEGGIHQLTGVPDDPPDRDLDHLRAKAHQVVRLSFEDLTFLAMTPKRGGMSVLAVSGAGPTIQVPIAADDEARAGEVVAAAAARVRRALFGARHAQLGALVFGGAVAAFWLSFTGWVPGGGVLLLLFAAVFVLLLWRRTTIASFGAMSLAAGISAWSQVSGHSISAVDGLCMALLVVCGVGPLWIAARSTKGSGADTRLPDGGAWTTGLVFLIASLPATVGLLSATATGEGALFLSALSRGSGGVVFTWVAAGAALLVVPGHLRRCLAAALLVLGAGIGVARTDTWIEAVAGDPMARGAPIPSTRRPLPEPVARFSVDDAPWDLRVTHDGATVVLGSDVAPEHTHGAMHLHRFAIRSIAEPEQRTFVSGYALALGRDDRALLLAPSELGPELRWIDLSEPTSVHWSHRFDVHLPGEPQLRIVGDEFVLVAESHEKRVVARGLLGGAADRITIDTSPVVRGVWPLYTSAPDRLVVESSGEKRGARFSLERMLWIVRPPADLRTITWWRSDTARRLAGPSAVSPWCELANRGSSSILCVAESGGSRWLWSVEDGRTLVPLGRTKEFGWWRWTGRRLVALGENDLAVVEPSAKRAVRFTLPRATRHEVRFDASPAAIVLGWPSDDGLEIEVYRGLAG